MRPAKRPIFSIISRSSADAIVNAAKASACRSIRLDTVGKRSLSSAKSGRYLNIKSSLRRVVDTRQRAIEARGLEMMLGKKVDALSCGQVLKAFITAVRVALNAANQVTGGAA
jgi:hypothetical protein